MMLVLGLTATVYASLNYGELMNQNQQKPIAVTSIEMGYPQCGQPGAFYFKSNRYRIVLPMEQTNWLEYDRPDNVFTSLTYMGWR